MLTNEWLNITLTPLGRSDGMRGTTVQYLGVRVAVRKSANTEMN